MKCLTNKFEKLLLSELRLAAYTPGAEDDPKLTDEMLAQAVTVNEELINLGFTLKPKDLAALAGSPSLTGFAKHFRSLLPNVSAPPMYPDFPLQVMGMSEAEFRLHQIVHYFSTYGFEQLLGSEVKRGWLPDVTATEKTESDDTLLRAKVLELVPEDEAPLTALTRIMQKRERLTLPGQELTVEALPYLEPEDIAGLKVPFKENLAVLFDAILRTGPEVGKTPGDAADRRVLLWRQICQHTGDVMKSTGAVLPMHRYHFRTSEKRAIVKLLESYPVADFKANLILSRGKREECITILQFLDYNMYSRSAEHKEAVRALRNGELRSWEAQAKYLLASGDEGALDFIAKRPGMMLRMIGWLLRMGYPDAEIRDRLAENAGKLSAHTIIDILNALDFKEENAPQEEIYRRMRAEQERYIEQCSETVKNPEAVYAKYRLMLAKGYADEVIRNAKDRICRCRREIREMDREYKTACDLYRRTAPYSGRVRAILEDVLRAHMEKAHTELAGKKVFVKAEEFELSYSRLEGGKKSSEGGYLPSGMAIRIPEEVKRLRFFVYWNDKNRVDVDLHAAAYDLEGEFIHVGWDAHFNKSGIVHSGDITHSNAAEYIDIDMAAPLRNAEASIHLYSGKQSFGQIETCYVGMMAVKRFKEKVKLYDPKNCFFTHELRSGETRLTYGYVDVKKRLLFFTGRAPEKVSRFAMPKGMYRETAPTLSLKRYLDLLVEAQGAAYADSAEEADLILTIGKPEEERAVSLVDRNFFLEA